MFGFKNRLNIDEEKSHELKNWLKANIQNAT
jgi:hypothetical protein